MDSPYNGHPENEWPQITENLINAHPLKNEMVSFVQEAWSEIFKSNIGGLRFGKELFPEPQLVGTILHNLIGLIISKKYPEYKIGLVKEEKDIHNTINPNLSLEIKTSSSDNKIFANRSYGQPQSTDAKKNKNGYFLAVNFEKIEECNPNPKIKLIRIAYLEHTDWIAQSANTGQQAHLSAQTYRLKFVTLYP